MKHLIAICCIAALLGGCRAGTVMAVTNGLAQGMSGVPSTPRPQVVQVEVERRPIFCSTMTNGNLSHTSCN